MGLFLNMFAVRSESRDEVADVLIKAMESANYTLSDRHQGGEYTGQYDEFAIVQPKGDWVQVFADPESFSDIVQRLSTELQCVAFYFMIYDGDFWQYEIFERGELRDKFCQNPVYFQSADAQERAAWRGDPETISALCGVAATSIAPYLRFQSEIKPDEKAFAEDRVTVESEWSMIDFQDKLGMQYPDFDKPNTLDLLMLRFTYQGQSTIPKPIKPWWKFW